MSIYCSIYHNLCEDRKKLKQLYIPYSNLHRHHIIPKHSGGLDMLNNFTFLTVREHIIAHFLLWKIYRNPNDLRAMKMLGAKLSSQQRRIIGLWCKDNKIGFHNPKYTDDIKKEWGKKSFEAQKDIPNSYYFWASLEGRKKRASMGGKIGGNIQKEKKLGIHGLTPEQRKINGSKGGKALKGRIAIHKPNEKGFKRILPEELQSYLEKGYCMGCGKNKFIS